MNHELAYEQSTGALYLEDRNNSRALLAVGYSGAPGYVNNPRQEGEVAKGPIPVGMWLVGTAVDHPRLGPVSIPLRPYHVRFDEKTGEATVVTDSNRLGRSGFYIHGDNAKLNQSASSGCIIMPRGIRDAIVALKVKRLFVDDYLDMN